MAMRSSAVRQAVRSFCTKEELWRTLHPIPDTHKAPSELWQHLHPLVSHPTLDAKQEVFKNKEEVWRHHHPLVETVRVTPSPVSHAASPSHSGWSATHATPGSELWHTLHNYDGITFRPKTKS
eukprot:CAMPEP_0173383336 /NCGR_PEP_ID=MMETSP1356-20130122/5890_1 /TAXON_ID=77927 ORGANISM="Hemiselmis virescens, Strain PCC157" /NCGR_SAMPLE_ID=MMETSP1356 /ASSEMBLY_ACC=CAM_ASM_000847 /LENGTH=122 /DNA_ID=CAMNT_0014338141 /DNA_START=18 /DNA_END=386 /DNA_ORIENTATION=-